jgi:hypothetical protein
MVLGRLFLSFGCGLVFDIEGACDGRGRLASLCAIWDALLEVPVLSGTLGWWWRVEANTGPSVLAFGYISSRATGKTTRCTADGPSDVPLSLFGQIK